MILGLSAYYHDSAAALIDDKGQILAACQEERFSRLKGDSSFPQASIKFCLKQANIKPSELSAIVYYEKPWLTFERILESLISIAPRGFEQFEYSLKVWFQQKFFLKQILQREFKKHFAMDVKEKMAYCEHHLSHGASAFYPSPFQSAAILTVDGVGEWATSTIAHGEGSQIKTLQQMNYPHSWGLLYASFTQFLGFKVNSGEYKMMGLAPYSSDQRSRVQEFIKIIETELIQLHSDGSLTMNIDQFEYYNGLRMIDPNKWSQLFKISPRVPETQLNMEHADLALAIQRVLEKGIIRLAQTAKNLTGESNLSLSGGVALNCVANGRLLREKIFDQIWVQPAADDAGGALGAALAYLHLAQDQPRKITEPDGMKSCALGPSFKTQEIKNLLDKLSLNYTELSEPDLFSNCAQQLHSGKIMGWFRGAMEWGPRALGQRSILARANDMNMQKHLNLSIKHRESFRPFAPIVLDEDFEDIFEGQQGSPYMLFTYPLQEKYRHNQYPKEMKNSISEQLESQRSAFQAITHMDFSARVETVKQHHRPDLYALLQNYKQLSGHGLLVNTSFNRRGEPIVCQPQEALRCFFQTEMDILVLENFIIDKNQNQNPILPEYYQQTGIDGLD